MIKERPPGGPPDDGPGSAGGGAAVSGYSVMMERSPGVSDGEARARISRVYALLLRVAQSKDEEAKTGQIEKAASDDESLGEQDGR